MQKNDLAEYTAALYHFFNKMVTDTHDQSESLNDFFTNNFCMYSNAVKVAGDLNEFSENLKKLKKMFKKVEFDLPFKDILVDDDKVCILLDIFLEYLDGEKHISHVMAIYYLDRNQNKFNKKIEITTLEKI